MINRRNFFKKSGMIASLGITSPSLSFNIINSKKDNVSIVGHGNFKYRVNKEWGIQDPVKIPVKDCHEMVQDSKGRLILATNHPHNNIIIYDKSGKVLELWTLNLPGAHGLTLSKEGDEDFLFITDSEINKVYKTTIKGEVLLELTASGEIADYQDPKNFKPTEVAIAPNGDFYVADGYGKNYIIQYNSKGEYIRHFGGTGDAENQFDCCHGITIDERIKDKPVLLITSRSKQEFKKFTLDGKHLETLKLPGCWICRPVIHGENLYFAVIVTKSWWAYDGMVAVLNKNDKVVSLPGGSEPFYENNLLKPSIYDGQTFLNPHDVCVDDEENLYIPQWYSGRTYPVKLERIKG